MPRDTEYPEDSKKDLQNTVKTIKRTAVGVAEILKKDTGQLKPDNGVDLNDYLQRASKKYLSPYSVDEKSIVPRIGVYYEDFAREAARVSEGLVAKP